MFSKYAHVAVRERKTDKLTLKASLAMAPFHNSKDKEARLQCKWMKLFSALQINKKRILLLVTEVFP